MRHKLIASCGTTHADRREPQPVSATRVHVRLVDAQTGKPTPAMACISDAKSNEVRLPPNGRLCTRPPSVGQFYSGVRFDPDPNWIGPVRKMQGKGDNDDRSYVYEENADSNNSDIDFCEYHGRLIINYRWGTQGGPGHEYIAEAEFAGSEATFLTAWFPAGKAPAAEDRL